MPLVRTENGLKNQRLLQRCDLVVYTEGGDTCYGFEEVESGKYSAHSSDIEFWEPIFKHSFPMLKIKFKSVGSCSTVEEIALKIKTNNTHSVCCVIDSDYKDFLDKKISHRNVIYTKGYSWENDLLNINLIKNAYLKAVGKMSLKKHHFDLMQNEINQIAKNIKRWILVDLVLMSSNLRLFDKKKPLAGLRSDKPGASMSLNPQYFRRKMNENHRQVGKIPVLNFNLKLNEICGINNLLGKISIQISIFYLRRAMYMSGENPFSNDACLRFLMLSHSDMVGRKGYSKYRAKISRLSYSPAS